MSSNLKRLRAILVVGILVLITNFAISAAGNAHDEMSSSAKAATAQNTPPRPKAATAQNTPPRPKAATAQNTPPRP